VAQTTCEVIIGPRSVNNKQLSTLKPDIFNITFTGGKIYIGQTASSYSHQSFRIQTYQDIKSAFCCRWTLYIERVTGNVRTTWHWGEFVQPLLGWKSSKCYIFSFCVCSLRCEMRMRQIVICGLSNSTKLFNIVSQTARFQKKIYTENEMCILVFCTNFVRNISPSNKNWARYDQNVHMSVFT